MFCFPSLTVRNTFNADIMCKYLPGRTSPFKKLPITAVTRLKHYKIYLGNLNLNLKNAPDKVAGAPSQKPLDGHNRNVPLDHEVTKISQRSDSRMAVTKFLHYNDHSSKRTTPPSIATNILVRVIVTKCLIYLIPITSLNV